MDEDIQKNIPKINTSSIKSFSKISEKAIMEKQDEDSVLEEADINDSKTEERPCSAIQEEQPNRLALEFVHQQKRGKNTNGIDTTGPKVGLGNMKNKEFKPFTQSKAHRIKQELVKRVETRNGPYQVNPSGLYAQNRNVLYYEAYCL